MRYYPPVPVITNPRSSWDLAQHYQSAIAGASSLPVILYNVPGRTASNVSAETTVRLAHDFKNIIGIKEASGSFDQLDQIIRDKPDGFLDISGDDAIALPIIAWVVLA